MASMSSTLTTTTLRHWLVRQHQSFTKDFATGSLNNWVVCVGNEAGDLDTLASSIGFSFFATLSNQSKTNYIPVQQTKSTDFSLRAENIQVLKLANLMDDHQNDLPMPELICSDQIDFTKLTSYGAKYALLDHNRINTSIFGETAEVVAVIDHHQPEAADTLYRSANPRLIQVPTGSCASLVADYFSSELSSTSIPAEVADLLLSAIAIDTGNFKPISEDGKATEADMTAKQWLLCRSRFAPNTTTSSLSDPGTGFKDFYKQLAKIQKDVSSLTTAQLLLRDYKQSDVNGWSLGISSVPTPLEAWVEEKNDADWSKFMDAFKSHAENKKLDVASILTSAFKSKKLTTGAGSPKPGRRLVLLATGTRMEQVSNLLKQEQANLMADQSLQLSVFDIKDPASINAWTTQNHASVYIFIVGNSSASRKQVTPVLLKLMEQLGPKS
ncbi:hypothetical protein MJO28_015915 [Puccinia striiformis f. sp. tritici]|uniref:DHHA2 domain-containing protein n=4 Tax=Puccinia striiformis TaxID=27350 RepID=A0A0L0UU21_9BASI|nr:hypothetical protein Pst134EB_029753 [Puccinia striiformis f. sp. tritici]KAI9630115.1 hypothetical protein KEM48_012248 [Puccinia striiformis f. sp. tritici PST-130]KNE90508.1 hypothetical protein PSTG_16071 [Puccinia striiformis f. sp. tritici PST-78]POW05304.1 hypothetical protein PSTT_09783 [Puccinia striiformis]KAI7936176.1 hypothetical protein MJO29_015479 [Puccinia striiformis f. sp. tritici]